MVQGLTKRQLLTRQLKQVNRQLKEGYSENAAVRKMQLLREFKKLK